MAQANITITAETRQAESALDRVKNRLNSVDSAADKANRGFESLGNTARLAAGALTALTAGLGIREIVDYTARWTDLNSRLINATGNQHRAKEALDAISASARTTYSDLETTADVFLRNSMALNELGYTTNEQIKISTALNNAMAVSGARGDQAASALDAFSKAVAGGKMQGEDLNRILDNAPQLMQALADGLGITTEEFRKMVREGKITTDVMIPALLSQFDKLEKQAKDMPATISDGFVILQNSLFQFIGRMDEALGVSSAVAGVLETLADNVHLVIGGLAGIAIGVAALTLKMMGLATATALATGGLSILIAGGIGAALAAAAKEAGLFADMSEKAVDPLKAAAKAAEDAAAAEARRLKNTVKVTDEQKKALENLQTTVNKLKETLVYEREKLSLGETQANINKIIREENEKLMAVGKTLNDDQKARITGIMQELEMVREQTKEKENQKIISDTLRNLDNERILLAIEDTNERKVQSEIMRLQQQIGRELTVEEQNRLRTAKALVNTQQILNDLKEKEAKRIMDNIQKGMDLSASASGRQLKLEIQTLKNIEDAALNHLTVTGQLYKMSQQEIADARLRIETETQSKIDALHMQSIQNRLMMEKGSMAEILSEQDRAVIQRIGGEERQKKIVSDRIEFEKKTDLEKTKWSIDNLNTVFAALGAQNKKAFQASKALAIASALVNTYQGATKALATYPWPFGLIAAAAAVAAGLAQVSAIRSQQYSGRSLGGPVMSGTSYIVGENGPELFTPSTTGSITRNSDLQGGKNVSVNFTIVANDTAGFDQLLNSRKGVITQIISDAMLERGTRSMI